MNIFQVRKAIHEHQQRIGRNEEQINQDLIHIKNQKKELQNLYDRMDVLTEKFHHPLPRHGIDVAWGNPSAIDLKRARFSFIIRYYSEDFTKDLTRAEAEDYSHNGLDIVTIWENRANDALGGYNQGVHDAKQALLIADRVRQPQPSHSPIFFAVDFELQPGAVNEKELVAGYFKGCVDVLGYRRVGVYGGLATVKLCHERNLCPYLWQTLAWSGTPTVWYPQAQIRQVQVNQTVAGVSCDIDTAVASNFGQWRL